MVFSIFVFSNTDAGINFFDSFWDFIIPSQVVHEISVLDEIDGYNYPKLDGVNDSHYEITLRYVREIFSEYMMLNSNDNKNCEQIPLYRMYKSISKNSLAVMDETFQRLKDYFQRFGNNSEFEVLEPYPCYVAYVYEMMRVEGVDVSEYYIVVKTYMMMGDNDKLMPQEKRNIDDMFKLYGEFILEKGEGITKGRGGKYARS